MADETYRQKVEALARKLGLRTREGMAVDLKRGIIGDALAEELENDDADEGDT